MAPKKKHKSDDKNTKKESKARTKLSDSRQRTGLSEERDPLDLENGQTTFQHASNITSTSRVHEKQRTSSLSSSRKLPRSNSSDDISNIFQKICQGFQQDYANFVELFSARGSYEFKSFMDIWNSTKFHLVYSGQDTEAIVEEFTEMILVIVLNDTLSENSSLLHRVCSIYMLYALRNKQPCGVPPTVRVTQKNISCLKTLKEELRDAELLQALFVFSTLLRDGFFRFVITDIAYGLEKGYRKEISGKSVESQAEEITNRFSVTSQLDEVISSTDIGLEALKQTFQEYYEAKSKLPGTTNMEPLKELQIVDKNLPTSLKKTFDNMYEGETTFYGNKEVILKKKRKSLTRSPPENQFAAGCSDGRTRKSQVFSRTSLNKYLMQDYCEMVNEVQEKSDSVRRTEVPLVPSTMDMPDV